MFGIGGFELFIILIFGFLIFGPEKLPEIARIVGKGIARFKQAQDEVNGVIKSTDIYDPNSDEPFKDPMEALDKLAAHQEEKRAAAKKAASRPSSAASAPSAGAVAAKAQEPNTAAVSGEAQQPASERQDAAGEAPARQESFTERKARYERERAARKAAEEQARKQAEQGGVSGGDAASAATDAGKPSVEGGEE